MAHASDEHIRPGISNDWSLFTSMEKKVNCTTYFSHDFSNDRDSMTNLRTSVYSDDTDNKRYLINH